MKKPIFLLALACLLGGMSSAQASMMSFSKNHSLSTTNWLDAFTFAKFNTTLGTLTSVKFELSGLASGIGKVESKDADPSDVTMDLTARIMLKRPDGTSIAIINPLYIQEFSFSAFDGAVDFGGTSGASTGLVTSDKAFNSFISSSVADLALFSSAGKEMVTLDLKATGKSFATGAGNLVVDIATSAAGAATVTYIYTAAPVKIAEPETSSMLLGGLGLLGFMVRRRKFI